VKRILISWVGRTDLRAPKEGDVVGAGPLAQALEGGGFDEAWLVVDYPREQVEPYLQWLQKRTSARIEVLQEHLSSPTDFGAIYEAAVSACTKAMAGANGECELTFHLSPGTPAMAAVWIILAKTRFPAQLIESSREHGVRVASVPFDISADYLPDLLRKPDEKLMRLTEGLPPSTPEFDAILHRSTSMGRLIAKARRVAPRSVPVLILGESGTGKELLARAIHMGSPRRNGPFLAVNCGAIPSELVDSELFGHKKGAFTGAVSDRKGQLEAASGGTLFLDEIGDLPLPAQVKLLRALQESEITPVGSSEARKVDIRVICATNRNLIEDMAAGRFREDLFHRIAVGILQIPPLRDRAVDINLLTDAFLELINREAVTQPGYMSKKLSAKARNLLVSHSWPGNVRELRNTLQRAAIWSSGPTIEAADVQDAIVSVGRPSRDAVLGRDVSQGLNIQEIITTVARHYIEAALANTHDNKTRAAELLGLPSYQTLTNWMKRYGIESGT
jgi:DNA-binding NtrC family response regulator